MKKKQIIIPAPDGGLRTSIAPTLLANNELALAENVEFVNGRVRKRPGTAGAEGSINNSSTTPRFAHTFVKTTGVEVPIHYERGTTAIPINKVYAATTGASWTWSTLKKSSSDFQFHSQRTPAFLTARGKLFMSNGDTTDGLVYWSGTGDVASTHSAGTQNGIAVRLLAYFKERLVGANGCYCTGGSWSSELTSAIFYSSITFSDGTPVNPDSPNAWYDVDVTYNEIEPNDGSWITGLVVWRGRIYVFKETGIWVMYGEPKNFTIEKVTDIGTDSNRSIQKYRNSIVFLNKDGFHDFDGINKPVKIDDAISNLVPKVAGFDFDTAMDFELDTKEEWTNHSDDGSTGGDATSHINILDEGSIVLDTVADEKWAWQEVITSQLNVPSPNYKLAMKFQAGTLWIPSVLSKISLYMWADAGQTGDIYFELTRGSEFNPYPTGYELIDTVKQDIATDIPTTEGWHTVDFEADKTIVTPSAWYWIVVNCMTYKPLHFGLKQVTGLQKYVLLWWGGGWNQYPSKQGVYKVYITYYNTPGYYQLWDSGTYSIDLGATPDVWGYLKGEVEHLNSIIFSLRSSVDQSAGSWSGWVECGLEEIIPETLPKRRYLDLKIKLTRIDEVTSPEVKNMKIVAFTSTGETIERLIYSTVHRDKYICATNENSDGIYRTFVLDKDKWTIYPNQLIRGYIDYAGEKYLLTVDTKAKFHRMLRGEATSEFNYDYSGKGISGVTEWYFMKMRTKKFDCDIPNFLKLFRDIRFSVGTIFSDAFVQGTIKYKIDDNDWVTQYFQDSETQGDTSIIRLTFPPGTRGYYIQFQLETFVNATTDYGTPYNFKDLVLTYSVHTGLQPTTEASTTILTTSGNMVE